MTVFLNWVNENYLILFILGLIPCILLFFVSFTDFFVEDDKKDSEDVNDDRVC